MQYCAKPKLIDGIWNVNFDINECPNKNNVASKCRNIFEFADAITQTHLNHFLYKGADNKYYLNENNYIPFSKSINLNEWPNSKLSYDFLNNEFGSCPPPPIEMKWGLDIVHIVYNILASFCSDLLRTNNSKTINLLFSFFIFNIQVFLYNILSFIDNIMRVVTNSQSHISGIASKMVLLNNPICKQISIITKDIVNILNVYFYSNYPEALKLWHWLVNATIFCESKIITIFLGFEIFLIHLVIAAPQAILYRIFTIVSYIFYGTKFSIFENLSVNRLSLINIILNLIGIRSKLTQHILSSIALTFSGLLYCTAFEKIIKNVLKKRPSMYKTAYSIINSLSLCTILFEAALLVVQIFI